MLADRDSKMVFIDRLAAPMQHALEAMDARERRPLPLDEDRMDRNRQQDGIGRSAPHSNQPTRQLTFSQSVLMAETIERSLLDLDFASLMRRTFTPSPAAWEDQVLYFLLVDRFSDGREKDGYRDETDRPVRSGSTPLYRPQDAGRIDYDAWFHAGDGWQGGTLAGLRSKLGYLRRL